MNRIARMPAGCQNQKHARIRFNNNRKNTHTQNTCVHLKIQTQIDSIGRLLKRQLLCHLQMCSQSAKKWKINKKNHVCERLDVSLIALIWQDRGAQRHTGIRIRISTYNVAFLPICNLNAFIRIPEFSPLSLSLSGCYWLLGNGLPFAPSCETIRHACRALLLRIWFAFCGKLLFIK